jgi:hypothetical protein
MACRVARLDFVECKSKLPVALSRILHRGTPQSRLRQDRIDDNRRLAPLGLMLTVPPFPEPHRQLPANLWIHESAGNLSIRPAHIDPMGG